jgi:hypothetical protein
MSLEYLVLQRAKEDITVFWGHVKRCQKLIQKVERAGRRWLTPVILATQEAEIRRIMVQSLPGLIVHETLS